jgi:3'(2'), 5'-bisphosphate nucleotidase
MPAASDHELAGRVAEEAGRLLLDIRTGLAGGDPRTVGDEGDRRANELILGRLAEWRPDDKVLSEESPDDPARVAAERVWIIDPLDGTREFSEAGRTDWAVHVALTVAGTPVAGAVALPARSTVFITDPPPPPPPPWDGRMRIAVSRTRPPSVATHLQQRLGAELVAIGSAGAKTMAVVTGEVDVYLHAGGQYEWDSAAPVAVAAAAGLHTSRVRGEPLRYNQPRPWLPDLLVCRPELAEELMAAVKEVL